MEILQVVGLMSFMDVDGFFLVAVQICGLETYLEEILFVDGEINFFLLVVVIFLVFSEVELLVVVDFVGIMEHVGGISGVIDCIIWEIGVLFWECRIIVVWLFDEFLFLESC